MSDLTIVGADTVAGAGSTKRPGAIAAGPGLWQQDMEQEVMPGISRPQSMGFSEAGECW